MTLTLNKGFWAPADSGGDPYWDDVFYLFQAPDSGSTLTDSSDSGFTITAQNSCAPSTSYTLFQSQSLYLARGHATPYATATIRSGTSMPTNWTFSGDFTVEAWSYLPDSTKGSSTFVGLLYSGGICGFAWVTAADEGNGNSQIYDNCQICGGTFYKSYSNTFQYDEWNYIAWVRSGSGSNNNKIYSGISTDTSTTLRGQWTNTATYGSTGPNTLRMGGGSNTGFYLDSVRVTKGVARDVSSIPTSGFPTS
jgi:hypothetical protein